MDIEQKMKELTDIFTKTSKELADLVKKNEQLITEEVRRVEETIRKTSEACGKGNMDRIRKIKEEYANRVKACNEKATASLSAAKAKCEQKIGTAEDLVGEMKKIVKDCLETNEFIKCIANDRKDASKQRKEVTKELTGAVANSEISITEQLKEAAKCYASAKAEAFEKLQAILKETKECVEKMK